MNSFSPRGVFVGAMLMMLKVGRNIGKNKVFFTHRSLVVLRYAILFLMEVVARTMSKETVEKLKLPNGKHPLLCKVCSFGEDHLFVKFTMGENIDDKAWCDINSAC